MKENSSDNSDINNNKNSSQDNTGNMYSYNDGKKVENNAEFGAMRRSIERPDDSNIINNKKPPGLNNSIGRINPNNMNNIHEVNTINNSNFNPSQEYAPRASIVHINQNPPLYWMLFLLFGALQAIFILVLGFYYEWDSRLKEKSEINNKNKYKFFQDVTIMIFLGFGFLRAFLKHHSWGSIALNLIGGVFSFEFGLFCLICWSSILQKSWYNGIYNFDHFFDSLYLSASYIISFGAIFGKLSFPQYLVMILVETLFSSVNYVLIRQTLKLIDIGGTLTVHLYGAVFGVFFSIVSFCNENEQERINTSIHLGSDNNSNLFALFGSIILIPYWPSFNTALVEGNLQYRGIINTYFAIGGSIIGMIIMSHSLYSRKFKMEDIFYASFPGAIAIGGCCHIIKEFYLSIIFGLVSGVLTSLFFYIFKKITKDNRIKYHDTSEVLFYHGIPAFLGGIISSIFVGNLKNWEKNVPNFDYKVFIGSFLDYNNYGNVKDMIGRGAIQFAGIFISIAFAAISGLVAGFSIKYCNCHITLRYFNDSETFDVDGNEPFPWRDEEIDLKIDYKNKKQ
jgi:ammonium transporter Rh